MSRPVFNRATHFSIVWGVTLAVLTLVEWNSLDRDPLREEILLPFIQREVTVGVDAAEQPSEPDAAAGEDPEGVLRYEVEFKFNGPLFLACFFGPVLAFQGVGWLAARLLERKRPGG